MRVALLLCLLPSAWALLLGSHRPFARGRGCSPRAAQGVPRTLQPLRDHVLVEISSVPVETAAGILLPTMFETDDDFDVARSLEVRKGLVIAVGPSSSDQKGDVTPSSVAPGDVVIVGPRGGIKLQEEGKSVSESSLYMFKVPPSSIPPLRIFPASHCSHESF